jgi:hypothetical protein
MRLSHLSTDYVRVPVSGTDSGLPANPTVNGAPDLAFVAEGVTPSAGDWHAGEWETDATTSPATYLARTLVGPTAAAGALAPGTYAVWVRWTDVPEHPVLTAASTLLVY